MTLINELRKLWKEGKKEEFWRLYDLGGWKLEKEIRDKIEKLRSNTSAIDYAKSLGWKEIK